MADGVATRIMDNINIDAARWVREGVPMPERGAQWQEFQRSAIEQAKKDYENDQLQDVEAAERKYAIASGLSWEEWIVKANKLYSINPDNSLVTSIALGPTHGREWECESQVDARRKRLQLIRYKKYDHFIRGSDFKYDPDEPRGNVDGNST